MLRDTQPPKSAQHNKKVGHQVAHTNFPNNFLRCNTQVRENLKKKVGQSHQKSAQKKLGRLWRLSTETASKPLLDFTLMRCSLKKFTELKKGSWILTM